MVSLWFEEGWRCIHLDRDIYLNHILYLDLNLKIDFYFSIGGSTSVNVQNEDTFSHFSDLSISIIDHSFPRNLCWLKDIQTKLLPSSTFKWQDWKLHEKDRHNRETVRITMNWKLQYERFWQFWYGRDVSAVYYVCMCVLQELRLEFQIVWFSIGSPYSKIAYLLILFVFGDSLPVYIYIYIYR